MRDEPHRCADVHFSLATKQTGEVSVSLAYGRSHGYAHTTVRNPQLDRLETRSSLDDALLQRRGVAQHRDDLARILASEVNEPRKICVA